MVALEESAGVEAWLVVRVLRHKFWVLLLHSHVSVRPRQLGYFCIVDSLLTSNIFPIRAVENIILVDGVIHLAVGVNIAPSGASADCALLSISK